jgi:hypothetical protein
MDPSLAHPATTIPHHIFGRHELPKPLRQHVDTRYDVPEDGELMLLVKGKFGILFV